MKKYNKCDTTWEITGCTGMAICPIPAIWTKSPRPPQILQRMQRRLIHLPCPPLQEGRPRHGVSFLTKTKLLE